jgi:cytoskeletal protein CcmA (bactofilin family)
MIEDRSGSPHAADRESHAHRSLQPRSKGHSCRPATIRIEGELRGTLQCEGAVHVAEGGRVDATV